MSGFEHSRKVRIYFFQLRLNDHFDSDSVAGIDKDAKKKMNNESLTLKS
jgi:hypothetical protein